MIFSLRRLSIGILVLGFVTAVISRQGSAAETFPLRSAKPNGSAVRVTAKLEVGGHLKVTSDKDKKTDSVPMSVVAQFGYDEQRLDDGAAADHRLAARYYDDVQATIKIADRAVKPEIRDSRRLVAAVLGKDGTYLLSPGGPLSREELELIDIPGNTLVVGDLLPQDNVEKDRHWKPTDDTLARLLGLDAVGHTEVECVLTDVQDGTAEITLEGTLGGAINGVASEIELKGKLLFDVQHGVPKSLILAIKEERGISHVGPGLDVVAKLKLTMSPLAESKLLTPDVTQTAKLPNSDEAPQLEYVSAAKGYRFLYDRRWHITREEPDLVVLRLIDRGDLVAQCNVAPSTKAIDKPVELVQFQNDVQTALGKLFGKFERAYERGTSSGLRILESIASGTAQDLPIQWRYYLIHDRQGRALSVVFTLEAPLVDQFHNRDTPLVDTVEFLEPKVATGKTFSDER